MYVRQTFLHDQVGQRQTFELDHSNICVRHSYSGSTQGVDGKRDNHSHGKANHIEPISPISLSVVQGFVLELTLTKGQIQKRQFPKVSDDHIDGLFFSFRPCPSILDLKKSATKTSSTNS